MAINMKNNDLSRTMQELNNKAEEYSDFLQVRNSHDTFWKEK